MLLKNWEIKVAYTGTYEILTNDDSLVVIDQEDAIALKLKIEDDLVKIQQINYNNQVSIDTENKVITSHIYNYEDEIE